MKIFFSLLALVLFACVTRAANPSFSAFDANFFQVTGTGNNSIKIKTNAFTWLNAGGAQVWTNNAGTISNTVSSSVNKLVFNPSAAQSTGTLLDIGNGGASPQFIVLTNGGLLIGPYNEFAPSIRGLTTDFETTTANLNHARVRLNVFNGIFGDQVYNESIVSMDPAIFGLSDGMVAVTRMEAIDSGGVSKGMVLESRPTNAVFSIYGAGGDIVRLWPTAADGITTHVLDTFVPHTSGNLLEVKNASTNVHAFDWQGGMLSGRYAEDYWGASQGDIVVVRDTAKGDSALNMFWTAGDVDGGGGSYVEAVLSDTAARLQIGVSNNVRMAFNPFANATALPYMTDTAVLHTSAGLFENRNLGLAHFRTETTNGVSTPRITALGATSRPWQFGSVVSNATITASVTNYVELAVNGSLYKLVIANP